MSKSHTHILVIFLALALGGCSISNPFSGGNDAPPLEGERISVLELEESLEPENATLEAQGLITPAPWKNSFWPQAGGYPNHSMQNLALNEGELTKLWSTRIGEGSSDEIPLTAQPILVDGEIFTLDTESILSAFDINTGKRVWRINIGDEKEDEDVIGGGISYASGVLYVTNGFNEILAVHPATGEVFWREKIPAPARAAPTVMEGRIYITTLDNRLLALNARDGSLLWEHIGLSESASLVGAASSTANHDIVVPVFSSGEITALRVENGSLAWSDNLSNLKHFGGGMASLSDIRAQPVIDKGLVFAISFSGRIVAIDERTGQRVWQREIGGANTPWVAGNHIFILTSDNQIVALGRETGTIRWVTKIQNKKNNRTTFFTGPLLAGGRLIVAGTDGIVIEIAPDDGQIIRQWDAGDTIAISPIVAGGVLYLLSENGTLSAYN